MLFSLCSAAGESVRLKSLCKISLNEDGTPPDWIELVPPGKVTALDGRQFDNAEPEKVVERFNARPIDIPIDWEHASESKAPKGERSPAAGWIDQLAVRAGSIWGHVKEWTTNGAADLSDKSYRYISPAFLHTKKGLVLDIVSAGLTNKPALGDLQALASMTPGEPGETQMDPEFLASLNLPADATKADAMAAIRSLRSDGERMAERNAGLTDEVKTAQAETATARAEAPDLEKFVPRADHDAVVAKCSAAETKLEAQATSAKDKEIEDLISTASQAGQIVPASVEFYKASCAQEGGIERFKKFLETAPPVGDVSALEGAPAPGVVDAATATAAQMEIAANCGLSEEKFLAAK